MAQIDYGNSLAIEDLSRQFGEADTTIPVFFNYDENAICEAGTLTKYAKDLSSSSFVLDHTVASQLDNSTLHLDIGATLNAVPERVLNDIVNGYHKFFEHFREASLIASSSSATTDYTTGIVSLGTAGSIVSKIVAKESLNVLSVIFRFTATGTVTFSYSTDGSTWTTVANNDTVTFSPAVATLYWKCLESGGSTATLTDIEIDYKLDGE